MDIKQFEKYINQFFNQHQAEVDADEIWNNIKDQVEEKDDRKPIFWLWFLGAGLVMAFLWYQNTTPSDKFAKEQNQAGQSLTEGNKKTEVQDLTLVQTEASLPILEKKQEQGIHSSTSERPARITQKQKQVNLTESQNSAEAIAFTKAPVPSINNIDPSNNLNTISPNFVNRQVISPFDLIPLINISAQSITPPLVLFQKKKRKRTKKRPNRKPIKRIKQWKWASEFYGGADWSMNHFNDKNYDQINNRKAYESGWLSHNFGMGMMVEHRSGWLYSLGINYHRVNEKLKFQSTTQITEPTSGIVSVVVDRSGQIIESIPGTVNQTTTSKREVNITNHYNSINIPLGIGYRFRTKRSRLEWQAGLDFNLASGNKVKTLNNNKTTVSIGTNINNRRYRQKTGIGVWSSFVFVQPINTKTILFGGPYLRHQINSLTQDDYGLQHRQSKIGLRLGIRSLVVKEKKKRKR